jgi:hypothetical protein
MHDADKFEIRVNVVWILLYVEYDGTLREERLNEILK